MHLLRLLAAMSPVDPGWTRRPAISLAGTENTTVANNPATTTTTTTTPTAITTNGKPSPPLVTSIELAGACVETGSP